MILKWRLCSRIYLESGLSNLIVCSLVVSRLLFSGSCKVRLSIFDGVLEIFPLDSG